MKLEHFNLEKYDFNNREHINLKEDLIKSEGSEFEKILEEI